MTEQPDFVTAARAEAVRWWQTPAKSPGNVIEKLGQHMAEWARDHLAQQEPTDAEVEAAARAMYERGHADDHPVRWGDMGDNSPVYLADARAALTAAKEATR